MSSNRLPKTVSHSAGPLTVNSLWSSTTASENGKRKKAVTADIPRSKQRPKKPSSSSGGTNNRSTGKLSRNVSDSMCDGIEKLFDKTSKDNKKEDATIKGAAHLANSNGNYLSNLLKNTTTKVLGGSLRESKQKLKEGIRDYVTNHKLMPPTKNSIVQPSNVKQDDNKENIYIPTQKPILSPPKPIHFRQTAKSSPLRNSSPITQNILADAISPSVIGPTNIRFVTTDERETRDKQVTQALNIISQSMEPPVHNVDKFKDWVLEELRPKDESNLKQQWTYNVLDYLMGVPFTLIRAFWHYVVLEIHLAYNLVLLYVTFIQTPPIIYFVIGITLFWIKILYELYRDIMHRDDPIYSSEVAKELSIAAAISASMGFILNMKAQAGEINSAWWTGISES